MTHCQSGSALTYTISIHLQCWTHCSPCSTEVDVPETMQRRQAWRGLPCCTASVGRFANLCLWVFPLATGHKHRPFTACKPSNLAQPCIEDNHATEGHSERAAPSIMLAVCVCTASLPSVSQSPLLHPTHKQHRCCRCGMSHCAALRNTLLYKWGVQYLTRPVAVH